MTQPMISVDAPDGTGYSARVTYDGALLPGVTRAVVTVQAGGRTTAELTVFEAAGHLEILPENVAVNVVDPLPYNARLAADRLAAAVATLALSHDTSSPDWQRVLDEAASYRSTADRVRR